MVTHNPILYFKNLNLVIKLKDLDALIFHIL